MVQNHLLKNSRYKILKKEKWLGFCQNVLLNFYCVKEEIPGYSKGYSNNAREIKKDGRWAGSGQKSNRGSHFHSTKGTSGRQLLFISPDQINTHTHYLNRQILSFLYSMWGKKKNMEAGVKCLVFLPVWFTIHTYNLFKAIPTVTAREGRDMESFRSHKSSRF